jgi:hypothetical protein
LYKIDIFDILLWIAIKARINSWKSRGAFRVTLVTLFSNPQMLYISDRFVVFKRKGSTLVASSRGGRILGA